MDLLESGDERERPSAADLLRRWLASSPPRWVLAALSAVVAATLVGGVVGAVQVSTAIEREAARPRVDVLPQERSSSTVRGVSRGRIELLLVNRRPRPVEVQDVEVRVEGLQVLRVQPAPGLLLGALQQREVRISFVIPSCDALVLPGTISVALSADGQSVQRTQLPVYDAAAGEEGDEGVAFGACPPSARGADAGTPTDVAVRPAGGKSQRVGAGAEGFVRLEIRNGGAPVQLVSVGGRVPGVLFASRTLRGGRTIETDGLVVLRLVFRVPDCDRLQKTGWLVLRVERSGAVQELGLRVAAEPAAGLGPQIRLPVLLDACD